MLDSSVGIPTRGLHLLALDDGHGISGLSRLMSLHHTTTQKKKEKEKKNKMRALEEGCVK